MDQSTVRHCYACFKTWLAGCCLFPFVLLLKPAIICAPLGFKATSTSSQKSKIRIKVVSLNFYCCRRYIYFSYQSTYVAYLVVWICVIYTVDLLTVNLYYLGQLFKTWFSLFERSKARYFRALLHVGQGLHSIELCHCVASTHAQMAGTTFDLWPLRNSACT